MFLYALLDLFFLLQASAILEQLPHDRVDDHPLDPPRATLAVRAVIVPVAGRRDVRGLAVAAAAVALAPLPLLLRGPPRLVGRAVAVAVPPGLVRGEQPQDLLQHRTSGDGMASDRAMI